MRKSWHWLMGLAVSGVALWLAFREVNLAEVGQALRTANYLWLVPAVALILAGQVTRALSWQIILGHDIPLIRVFTALNSGYLLNNVLPLRVGELARAYLISRTGRVSVPQALSSVLVERVIDLCTVLALLFLLIPLVAFAEWTWNAAFIALPLAVGAVAVLYISALHSAWVLRLARWGIGLLARVWGGATRLENLFMGFLKGMMTLREPGRFLSACFWSVMAWALSGVSVWCIMMAFWPLARLEMGFFVLAVTALGVAVPSAPGAVGVWQAAVVGALSVFNTPPEIAASISIVHHLTNYLLTGLMGAWSLAQEGQSLSALAAEAQQLATARAPETP